MLYMAYNAAATEPVNLSRGEGNLLCKVNELYSPTPPLSRPLCSTELAFGGGFRFEAHNLSRDGGVALCNSSAAAKVTQQNRRTADPLLASVSSAFTS